MPENVKLTNNPSVRQIASDNDSYFGLKFPLTYKDGRDGFFPRAKTLTDQAYSNLKNLLLTRKGERLGQPTFGSDLWNIIFEQITDDIGDSVEQSIREAVDYWLPYITINNVFTTTDGSNPNTLYVRVEFIVNIEDPDAVNELTFTFNTGE
jgi:phage baseplate assembly protein W|tara:strand:- start:15986 stop:16438 length:453 start_codon:yes stop_codon:yes gene_type:complete